MHAEELIKLKKKMQKKKIKKYKINSNCKFKKRNNMKKN